MSGPHHPAAPITDPTAGTGDASSATTPLQSLEQVVGYSIDGSGNTQDDPTPGATGTDEARLAPANYAPGTTDTPVDGPNPRVISNAILANDPNNSDPAGRSAYVYAFGQFVDHDIDLTMDQTPAADGSNTLNVTVPDDDAFFAPGTDISIVRGVIDPANGAAVNSVTSYLDLSQVYGSDAATAASLRNPDGTLQTSASGNLPIVNGQFAGGDVRAAENPDLTSIDVLFVREHNYWVGQLQADDPSLSGDQLYAMARSITTAEYQNIVYSEFLPSLLGAGTITPYTGYQPSVNPTIYEEFADAAYRFGHSIISPTETRIANDGTVLQQEDLVQASGEPPEDYPQSGGADPLLRNLAQDSSQQEGVHINSDLLNLLDANPPGDIGDLGAIDIERERDLGIATLNQTRVALGMTAYTAFNQITSDPNLAAQLQSVYGSVDQIDLFVGGLAEDATGGSMVGPTFAAIIAQQFENLRDGDPLFFENQNFGAALQQQIAGTTLSDLILRDTDTAAIQPDAFVATMRHASDVASPDPTMPQLVIGIDADQAVVAGEYGVDNTIVAGLGLNQSLTGGGSADRFMFLGGGHADTVTDFQIGRDVLDFEGQPAGTGFKDVTISSDGAGSTVVQLGGNTVTLAGILPFQISAASITYNQGNPAQLAGDQLSGGAVQIATATTAAPLPWDDSRQ